jgi:hypothetical protein
MILIVVFVEAICEGKAELLYHFSVFCFCNIIFPSCQAQACLCSLCLVDKVSKVLHCKNVIEVSTNLTCVIVQDIISGYEENEVF